MGCCLVLVCFAGTDDPVRYVDPFIGTAGHGHTYPGPSVPFGMIQPGPDTRLTGWDGCSGYHDSDSLIYGFSHTHLSGTGASDYGDILLLPGTGALPEQAGSHFRKETESAEAGSYSVRLDDSGVAVELTATARTGWHRYAFPRSDDAYVLIDLQHRDEVLESSLRVVDSTTIEGFRRSRRWAENQPVYFVARFSKPFEATLLDGQRKAMLRFATEAGEQVLVKVALSAVDPAGARNNLEAEAAGWDFDRTRAAAQQAWREALARIEVEGATREQKTVFYTALYHALLQPNLFQDVDGRFLGRDGRVHRAEGYTRYTVFSLWDTFRAAHPLYTILERARSADFVRTFLEQYRESGRLPVWELWGNETDCMIGYHSVPVIVDAWVKGIRAFDATLALEAMLASARDDRFGLTAYQQQGFIPADAEGESVSRTLEYAYDDACIAAFAAAVGRDDVRAEFARRSQAWKHLVDPRGFMRPRAQGRWLDPFDPIEVTVHYTEANAWQYRFFVPQDVDGLVRRLGGPLQCERALDELFTTASKLSGRDLPDITGLVGQYAHGNEPSHHIAYLYALTGAPHKSQAMIRRLLDTLYTPQRDGLAGNEDCGQMSAWFVLSALGFYPVAPGTPNYVIGSPRFPQVTIRLENGRRFVIRASRLEAGPYIQSATLNGRPYAPVYLQHETLMSGGELSFVMGSRPARWGSAESDRPPTMIAVEPIVPAPIAQAAVLAAEPTRVRLVAGDRGDEVHYTTDGTEPASTSPRYTRPIPVRPPSLVRFRAKRGEAWSPLVQAPLRWIDPGVKLTLRHPFSSQYPAGGEFALLDGVRGGSDFRLGAWQGFEGVDLEAEIDLGAARDIHRLSTGFLHDQDSWIFFPLEVRYAVSLDGVAWNEVGATKSALDPHHAGPVIEEFAVRVPDTRGRFVRLVARSMQICPPWHKGAGRKAWVFADELRVE